MSVEDLLDGAAAYASLAEVAAVEPHTDAPAATGTVIPITVTMTVYLEC